MKEVIIIGSGLGGLATALRLSLKGYKIVILEKHSTPGGRLNQIKLDDFLFDLGPTFMSMTYELDELFTSTQIKSPLLLTKLDPLYYVYFEGNNKPYRIWNDINKLADEFSHVESNALQKIENYLMKAGRFYHDTEHRVIKSNFDNKLEYLFRLSKVPLVHLPSLFKSMWSEVKNNFESRELRVIFSLVAFFLGQTPFQTPSIYSVLSYTELKHNGYWRIEGGMYRLVEEIVKILQEKGVQIIYNTEITDYKECDDYVDYFIDQNGQKWKADIYISNSDAASFRGKIFKRNKYSDKNLDKMHWTLAPFTIYLGVKGKIDTLSHHNYFLGNNFEEYSQKIFVSSTIPNKPYYYVNVPSKSFKNYAPENCESIFILCPVPDLRIKQDWKDKEEFANIIIDDLSKRINFDIKRQTLTRKILAPDDWEKMLNLYKGSGLGLAHGIDQIGGFRPRNKDEKYKNVYYVGASTTPGTGLPMVIISSKLVTERLEKDYGYIS